MITSTSTILPTKPTKERAMKTLLKLYDGMVKDFSKSNKNEYFVKIKLDRKFLKTCRSRIIAGHRQYGDDWKTKDNLLERKYEEYDHFNYLMLYLCQEEWKRQKMEKDKIHYE